MTFEEWKATAKFHVDLAKVAEIGHDGLVPGYVHEDGSYIELYGLDQYHYVIGNQEYEFNDLEIAQHHLWTHWASANYV